MASIEQQIHGGNYRIVFRCGGRKFSRTLKTNDPHEADAVLHRLEDNLRLLERGRLTIPSEADTITFLLSDGRLEHKPTLATSLTLRDLVDRYRQHLPDGALEPNTLYTIDIHTKHLQRLLKPTFPVRTLSASKLQEFVELRASEIGRRGKKVSAVTIKKEVATLRSIWNWGLHTGHVHLPFPANGLKFPKTTEKPSFQTFVEIESQIKRGGLTEYEQDELWDGLFLTVQEVTQVLEHVHDCARHKYLHAMVVFAAQTGARRSELVRARVADIDFQSRTVVIREKKRVRGQSTTRRIPLSKQNLATIEFWLLQHPGGPWLFSRPYADTDGQPDGRQLTVPEVHHHLKTALADSRWSKIRGWHVFRHSFASNCAAKGVDQRMIDRWMGHQTEEMRKRYSHLIPTQQLDAINAVFG
ncbi:MAG: site-specific integrase [Planctomycetales bacterium]|nr:site-specific integrase [Planctomycetales bacterium]